MTFIEQCLVVLRLYKANRWINALVTRADVNRKTIYALLGGESQNTGCHTMEALMIAAKMKIMVLTQEEAEVLAAFRVSGEYMQKVTKSMLQHTQTGNDLAVQLQYANGMVRTYGDFKTATDAEDYGADKEMISG